MNRGRGMGRGGGRGGGGPPARLPPPIPQGQAPTAGYVHPYTYRVAKM